VTLWKDTFYEGEDEYEVVRVVALRVSPALVACSTSKRKVGVAGGGKTAVAKAKCNLDQTIYNSIHSLLEYMICMMVINIKLLWFGTDLKNIPCSVGDSGLMRSGDRREMPE
jgi:hypothetical protein